MSAVKRRSGPAKFPAGPPRVAVIGLGLLGGSLALALKQREPVSPPWHVVGVARDEETAARALAIGAVDEATTNAAAGVADADVVVFATPVGAIPSLVAHVAPFLKAGAVVTDVGSTKVELMRSIPPLLPQGVQYVGGHPMAGSERTGLEAADVYLLENAIYVVTPLHADQPGVERVVALAEAAGAQPLLMDARRHDRIVAAVSHLPHMVAAALVEAVGLAAEDDPTVLALAAGGFRDTTRVASGDPDMWRDIFISNRDEVLVMLDRFESVLQRLRRATAAADAEEIVNALSRARNVREQLPRHRQGILRPMCEIVVQLADKPGGISAVAGCIAERRVNIKDIEVLRVREGEAGTLRLAFETEEDMETALGALAAIGFVARRRG